MQISSALTGPIVLVGMMGSGKSHLGRGLAQALGLEFYDSDTLIEEKAGRSVADIFEEFGEQKFREAEKNTVLELLEKGKCVISTGGGAVTTPETLEAIKALALSVWLRAGPEAILERLHDHGSRPLLQTPDPQKTLHDLLAAREPLYARADLTVETGGESAHAALNKLIKTLHNHLYSG